jgi:hypothetical protein
MSTPADRVFVPEQLDFATRSPPPAGDPSGPAGWAFSYRPAVSGTLRYPDGSTGGTRVELTETGTNRGLRGHPLPVSRVGESGVPAAEVPGEVVVQHARAHL